MSADNEEQDLNKFAPEYLKKKYDKLEELEEDNATNAGICLEVDCDYTTDIEPDESSGYCAICGTNTVCAWIYLALCVDMYETVSTIFESKRK